MKVNKDPAMFLSILSVGFITTPWAEVYASEYELTSAQRSGSGLEVRANVMASSGRYVQDIVVSDAGGNTLQTDRETSDLTSNGFSLLVGYGREYVRRDKSSFMYIGFDSQKWSDEYDSTLRALLVGAEGGIGSRSVKFIYGSEFGFGSLKTGATETGDLFAFSFEPFIGFRMLFLDGLSVNLRVGARAFSIEETTDSNAGNVVTNENSAFTANAQIGVGYSFY